MTVDEVDKAGDGEFSERFLLFDLFAIADDGDGDTVLLLNLFDLDMGASTDDVDGAGDGEFSKRGFFPDLFAIADDGDGDTVLLLNLFDLVGTVNEVDELELVSICKLFTIVDKAGDGDFSCGFVCS